MSHTQHTYIIPHIIKHTYSYAQLSRALFRAQGLFNCIEAHTLENPGLITCYCHPEILNFGTPNFHFALSPQLMSLTAKRVWRAANSLTLKLSSQ